VSPLPAREEWRLAVFKTVGVDESGGCRRRRERNPLRLGKTVFTSQVSASEGLVFSVNGNALTASSFAALFGDCRPLKPN